MKGWTTDEEGVENNTDGPSIDFEAVTVCCVEKNFWGDVIWGTANGLLPFTRVLNKRSKAKVTDFDVHVGVEEQITEFEVTVNDLVRVHIVACTDELYQKEACFWFCEATPATEHVHERATVTEFEGHVYVVIIFETFVKADDVWMRKGAMDLYFRVELMKCKDKGGVRPTQETDLCLCLFGLEGGLGDHFARVAYSAGIPYFIDASEATL